MNRRSANTSRASAQAARMRLQGTCGYQSHSVCNAGSYDRPGSISTNARFLALELANDYGMVPWIAALLDETEVKNPDDAKKNIAPPPKYKLSASEKSNVLPWDRARASTPGRGRGRPRATTPSKSATPATKAGSPRKQRTTKAMKEANAAAPKRPMLHYRRRLKRRLKRLTWNLSISRSTVKTLLTARKQLCKLIPRLSSMGIRKSQPPTSNLSFQGVRLRCPHLKSLRR